MRLPSHIQIIDAHGSTSKVIFRRDWERINVVELQKWLFAHYGVRALNARPASETQVQIIVGYKTGKRGAAAYRRAHSVDGFIGGWLSALELAGGDK